MFLVTEAEGAAIRAVFEQEGELSAVIELRRLLGQVEDTGENWSQAEIALRRLCPRT